LLKFQSGNLDVLRIDPFNLFLQSFHHLKIAIIILKIILSHKFIISCFIDFPGLVTGLALAGVEHDQDVVLVVCFEVVDEIEVVEIILRKANDTVV